MSMMRSSIRLVGTLAFCAVAACGGRSLLEQDQSSPVMVSADPGLPPCAAGLTQCGKRDVSLCYDLANSKDDCGACGHACAPGIACQAGTCQQVRCTGPLTFQALNVITIHPSGPYLPYRPALGDFDGDGILDLAGIPEFGTAGGVLSGAKVFTGWSVYYGVGDGTFVNSPHFEDTRVQRLQDIAVDLDGDGLLDLVSLREDLPGVNTRRGTGKRGTPFGEDVPYPTSQVPDSLLVADLDSDGHRDLMAGVGSNTEHWRGVGDGRFQHQATLATTVSAHILQAVDWNGDGAIDLMFGWSNLRLRYGHGDGTFDPVVVCGLGLPGSAVAPFNIAADLDHDNTLDLVGRDNVFLGIDRCSASRIVPLAGAGTGTIQAIPAIADMNGDGNLDILAVVPVGALDVDGDLVMYLGDGKGGFAGPTHLSRFGYTNVGYRVDEASLVGDVNRDGKLDVILAQPEGWQVLLNTCQ